MKKIIKLKLGVSLLTITFSMLGGINQAIAQTCTTPPSCATLGYKQSASDCTGQQMLKCPFDNSKVFCGGTDCDSSFTLSSCDTTKGFCITCNGKYKYTSCNNGWTLSNGNCTPNSCSGYQSCSPSIGTISSDYCMSGTTKQCKYSSCNSSWILKNGNCIDDWDRCGLKSSYNCMYEKRYIEKYGPTNSCIVGGISYDYNTSCLDGTTPNYGGCGFGDESCR